MSGIKIVVLGELGVRSLEFVVFFWVVFRVFLEFGYFCEYRLKIIVFKVFRIFF